MQNLQYTFSPDRKDDVILVTIRKEGQDDTTNLYRLTYREYEVLSHRNYVENWGLEMNAHTPRSIGTSAEEVMDTFDLWEREDDGDAAFDAMRDDRLTEAV